MMLGYNFASDDLIEGMWGQSTGSHERMVAGGGEVTSIMVPGEDVGVSFCLGQVRGSH